MSLPFHPLVQRWFDERFESPTDAQKATGLTQRPP